MVEGDDQSIDIVTYEDVTINTKRGPVTKKMQVPVRPLESTQETSELRADEPAINSTSFMDSGPTTINDDKHEEPPRTTNKVRFHQNVTIAQVIFQCSNKS
jgi:hypothetical protein